jgi:hypothetical protein
MTAMKDHGIRGWQPVETAPFDRELQLSVIEGEVHSLVFPCRRTVRGWVSRSGRVIEISPTHWRDWKEADEDSRC